MKLEAHDLALEMIKNLKPLVAIIARHDRSLADQIKRSGFGVALVLGEGVYSRKGNQPARFQEALASAGRAGELRGSCGRHVKWRRRDGSLRSPVSAETGERFERWRG